MCVLVVVDGSALGALALTCAARWLAAAARQSPSRLHRLQILDVTSDGTGLAGAAGEAVASIEGTGTVIDRVAAPGGVPATRLAALRSRLDASATDFVVVGMDYRATTVFGGPIGTWDALSRAAERGVSVTLITRPLVTPE